MRECCDNPRLDPEKRQKILHAALQVFFELGFERATVDVIAARAGVSKATIYNHFKDKPALFVACVLAESDAMASAFSDILPSPPNGVEQDLQLLGERLGRLMLSPAVATLHQIIAAEVRRFPDLGRALYERGLTRCRSVLARFFEERSARGELELDDPATAAMQFFALCHTDLKVRVDLGLQETVSEDDVRTAVRQAVTAFLRAYGARSSA